MIAQALGRFPSEVREMPMPDFLEFTAHLMLVSEEQDH